MSITTRSYSSGTFLFSLDGTPDQSYIKSVEGGTTKGSIVEERVGPAHMRFKHLSTIEIEPISLELGMSISRPFMQWIQESWERNHTRRNGAIIHADFNATSYLEHSFEDALVTETIFPMLDGADRDSPYLSVKLHPERVAIQEQASGFGQTAVSSHQKMWSGSGFRLEIDGLDCSMVNKIDSFSVKQNVRALYVGSQRHPEMEPTSLEFGNITIYMALAHAGPFLEWHDQFIQRGARAPDSEKTGAIVYLGPGNQELLTVELFQVGIYSFVIEKAEANAEGIQRAKIELYVERMKLQPGAGFS